MLADAEELSRIEQAGKLCRVGNWQLGQTLNHLACWADYAHDGLPMKIPFFVRWMGPLLKKAVLKKMPVNRRIPGVKGGTLATVIVPTDEALAHLRISYERLQKIAPPARHPVFGNFSHQDWLDLHLRHAELHLSFLIPATSDESPAT